ncbi:MAG: beta-lactamase family protein [Gemmatimonadales bacterium]|nr:beta-lactamase family protein [Gemmatimonadales bacterium]
MRLILAKVSLLVLVAGCAQPERQPELDGTLLREEWIRVVDSLRVARQIPGLAIVALHDTTVVLARGLGLADLASGRPVTPETPFDLASVAKPIAGVVALQLVEAGQLDLDRPMREFRDFPEFCSAAREAGGTFFQDFACEGNALTLRHLLSMTANGEEPGTRFWYNPPAFSWASRPMAEAGGQTYSALVDSLVFRPSGMVRSARRNRALPLPPGIDSILAVPYHRDSTGAMVRSAPPPPQGDGAAGGVIASAIDLARFDQALMQGRLLSSQRREELWRPMPLEAGAVAPYGLGWFLGRYRDRRVVWHTGLWEDRYSALYLKVLGERAADRYTLILLANSDGLRWPTNLDEAAIDRSPFAVHFLDAVLPAR